MSILLTKKSNNSHRRSNHPKATNNDFGAFFQKITIFVILIETYKLL